MRKVLLTSLLLGACLFGSSAVAGDLVPIQGSFGTTFFIEFEQDPELGLILRGTNQGFGQAMHLGRTEILLKDVGFATPNGLVADSELFVLTAANGDELWAEYRNMPLTPDLVNGTAVIGPGLMEFVGGTGRFEGATGSATFEATADLQSATAQISFEGEVSTVGSLK